MRFTLHFALATAWVALPAIAADPADDGRRAFEACAPCHSTATGSNGAGPTLFGVVGRAPGSVPGFLYSRAMKNASLTWTPQELDAYIANPQSVIPGNRMPYSGMPDAAQRTALVAFLASLK